MKRILSGLAVLSVLISSCISPYRSFKKTKKPKTPDYSNEKYWAALPTKKDSADAIVPKSGLKDGQKDALVDVFFVHPTTYIIGSRWNMRVNNKRINRKTDKTTIRHQASIFNSDCKVYAPRYRQAIIQAYADGNELNAVKAFDMAYADVKTSFEYYLKHFNNDRPIIIAAHSQGTDHAVRLLCDFFDRDSLLNQKLVVAYLVGRPVAKKSFEKIALCDSANQTGCFVAWNAAEWGETKSFKRDLSACACTNPLTWKNDTVYAPVTLNKGSVPFNFRQFQPGIVDAKCTEKGLLWVHTPSIVDYPPIGSSHHRMEYNLYHSSIRENVKSRINSFLNSNLKK